MEDGRLKALQLELQQLMYEREDLRGQLYREKQRAAQAEVDLARECDRYKTERDLAKSEAAVALQSAAAICDEQARQMARFHEPAGIHLCQELSRQIRELSLSSFAREREEERTWLLTWARTAVQRLTLFAEGYENNRQTAQRAKDLVTEIDRKLGLEWWKQG